MEVALNLGAFGLTRAPVTAEAKGALPNDCQKDWQSPVFRGAHWLSLVRLGGGLSELKTENAGVCSPQAFYAPDALAALTFVTLC